MGSIATAICPASLLYKSKTWRSRRFAQIAKNPAKDIKYCTDSGVETVDLHACITTFTSQGEVACCNQWLQSTFSSQGVVQMRDVHLDPVRENREKRAKSHLCLEFFHLPWFSSVRFSSNFLFFPSYKTMSTKFFSFILRKH